MANILIVDDRATNREFLVTLLGYAGHELHEATDGRDALEKIQAQDFDLVISDVLMPEVDGYELIRQLRSRKSARTPAVMFYTGHYVEHDARKLADSCGVKFILTKPCEPQKILDTVNLVLKDKAKTLTPVIAPETFDRDHVVLLTNKLHQKIAALEMTNLALSESKRSLSTLMSHLPGAAYRSSFDSSRRLSFASEGIFEITGYSPADFMEGRVTYGSLIHPEDQPVVWGQILTSTQEKRPYKLVYRIQTRDNQQRWVWEQGSGVFSEDGILDALEGFTADITERHPTEEKLNQTLIEVARANADLKQFAYVASHDLKEPLRMVSAYVMLLSKRYKGRLDEDADVFIDYAVSGVKRMGALIDSLLLYARLGRESQAMAFVDSSTLLKAAVENLKFSIEETNATVGAEALPTIYGDSSQLLRVFQNIISNAIKFKAGRPPEIHISAKKESSEWVFALRDNGIGFDEQYADRIFMIFQRLHSQETYPGTGVGLALCRKIIEQHGGRTWAKSEVGIGTTIYFTLPASVSQTAG